MKVLYVESVATLKLVRRVELPDGTDPETAIGDGYSEDGSPTTPFDQWTVLGVTDTVLPPDNPIVPVRSTDDIMAEFFPWS